VERAGDEQSLTAEDQLFILMQAGLYLLAARGMGSPDARICYERAEPLCRSLNHPRLLCFVLRSRWRYTLITDKMSAAMQIAERVHSLAQEQNDAALMIGAYMCLTSTLYFLGHFEPARQYALRGVQIWHSGNVQSYAEDLHTPVVACLCYLTLSEWHLGKITSRQANMDEAISIAKQHNHMNALALALAWAAGLSLVERNPAEVDRLASDLIKLFTRYNFVYWLAIGTINRGWARSASGATAEGILWIEQGIRDLRATGTVLALPYYLGLKAEALHLADRTSEALQAINEAQAMAERFEQRIYFAELYRLRGILLATLGAEEAQIEASFCEAVDIAREQKSISVAKSAEAIYAEYRSQKANASEGHGVRLPLW
jgi:predicted ATPase